MVLIHLLQKVATSLAVDRVMAVLAHGGFAEQALADEVETFAIPDSWYRNRVTVLDVLIERQEFTDGAWGPAVIACRLDSERLRALGDAMSLER